MSSASICEYILWLVSWMLTRLTGTSPMRISSFSTASKRSL